MILIRTSDDVVLRQLECIELCKLKSDRPL